MKKLWWLGLVILLAGGSLAWAEEKIIDPKTLEGKTLEEIYLMRNEIYARNGKPFKTYELDSYFRSQDWYKLNLEFKDSLLTKADWKNISILQAKEKELLQHNYVIKDGQQRLNFNNIINTRQFGAFTPEEKEKISTNGFLVVPAKHEQFFYVYDSNYYYGVASFITTDSVLQLYHIFFDYTLRNLEEKKLFPLLRTLTEEMFEHSKNVYNTSKNPQIKEAARRNMAFFAVPQYFLTDELPEMGPSLSKLVKEEIDKCKAHEGRKNSLIFNPKNDPNIKHMVDYSQFIPRGHYTRSEELESYFMAMMWLGNNSFVYDEDTQLLQALLITNILYGQRREGKPLIDLWEKIYEPTVFYVGASTTLDPADYHKIMLKVFGESKTSAYNVNDFVNKAKLEEVKKLIPERYYQKQRIEPQMWYLPQGPKFRFMGQRYTPDANILQQLSKYPERIFPKGLDVTAALGSQEGKRILLEDYKEGEGWEEYPPRLEKLIKEFKELKPDDWRQNLYYNWLLSLKSLIELSQEYKYPFFMQTQGWQRKSLSSSLASWAELRHDTILYAEQSASAECGGGVPWIPDPPKSYVEPNIVFYDRLWDLLNSNREGLQKRDLLTPEMKDRFHRFLVLVSFLKEMSVKELQGESLTKEQNEWIQFFGGRLESLTLSVITDDPTTGWYDLKGETDKNIAVIADVHTFQGSALEVGVGPAFEIYVVTEIGGQLKLTRGAVFSYYEFIHPASDRLTDEKWQKMIKDRKEPPLPSWTKIYLSDKLEHKIPKPKFNYTDPCR